jgi:hypothetical protein
MEPFRNVVVEALGGKAAIIQTNPPMTIPPNYVTSIPPDAEARIVERHKGGAPRCIEYVIQEEVVGRRTFDPTGELEDEQALRNGVRHGWQYRWSGEDSHLLSAEPFEDGLPHGTAYQFGHCRKRTI